MSSRSSERPTGEDGSLIEYELPPDRIAQRPASRRERSRLLVLDRDSGETEDRVFEEIVDLLEPDDLLVVNDTRVIPARLRATRPTGGRVELLLLEPDAEGGWRALLRPGKAGRTGQTMRVEGARGELARVIGRDGDAFRVSLETESGQPLDADGVRALCDAVGEAPLPPYIRRSADERRDERDRTRYQTVWAERPGAVAAPTAGLHFSTSLLDRLAARGVERVAITLHVGVDTFRPLTERELTTGELHGERVEIPREAGERVLSARREGRRIVAVGTTVVRALESFARDGGRLPYRTRTRLFIRPGHEFRLVDALVTNFHLPRSSLLLLVSAFAGRDRVLRAYDRAIRERYRFYSYGDAMFIR